MEVAHTIDYVNWHNVNKYIIYFYKFQHKRQKTLINIFEVIIVSLSIKSKLKDVLKDPDGKKVLEKYFSEELKHPMIKMAMGLTLEQIAKKAGPEKASKNLIDKIDKELRNL